MTTDEKFIESVKKYPCLWNTLLSTYKCNETKDAAWELVAKETNIKEIQTAKTKWKKLRDGYRDALKRQNSSRSGQAMKQLRPWKYQHIMEFLVPHMSNRNRTSNFTADPEVHDDNTRISANSNTENDSANSEILEELSHLEDFTRESINDRSSQSENLQSSTQDLSSNTSLPSTSKTHKRKADFSEFLQIHQENREQLMKERAEIKEILKFSDTTDEIDHFFLSIAKSLKKLPAYLQRQVKRKAMAALMEAEDILEQDQQILYGYSTDLNPESVPTATRCSPDDDDVDQTNVLQNNAESQNREPTPPGIDED